MIGIRTRGRRMVGADGSTEPWRPADNLNPTLSSINFRHRSGDGWSTSDRGQKPENEPSPRHFRRTAKSQEFAGFDHQDLPGLRKGHKVGYTVFKKLGQSQPLFLLFSSFQANITIFTINISIQDTVLGFEPTTFRHESTPITTRPGLLPWATPCYY